MESGVRPELEERPDLLLVEEVLEYPERGSLSVLVVYLGSYLEESYLGSYVVRPSLGSVGC